MPDSSRLEIRIDPDLLAAVDRACQTPAGPVSRSAWIKQVIKERLKESQDGGSNLESHDAALESRLPAED